MRDVPRSHRTLPVLALLSAVVIVACDGEDPRPPSPVAPGPAGLLQVAERADGLWFEQNGLPVCNGDMGVEAMSLDGPWRFREDPSDTGLAEGWEAVDHDLSGWRTIQVPAVWNAAFEDLFLYEGTGWYAVDVDTPDPPARPVLAFGAVFLVSEVYVNGTLVGGHRNGYAPFWVDAADAWRAGSNRVVVRVSNQITGTTIPVDTVAYPGRHGWWPYGGILRSVRLQDWPDVTAFRLNARYDLSEDLSSAALDFRIGLACRADAARSVTVGITLRDPDGRTVLEGTSAPIRLAAGEVKHLGAVGTLDPIRLWDVGAPQVYEVAIQVRDARGALLHTARHATGFRSFEIRDADFFLNGRRHVLRGINRHDDLPGTGSALTAAQVERDLDLIQGLGADHTRPGHYPAHPGILSGCRDRGITVTEEIPVYQLAASQFGIPELVQASQEQLIEMIERDRNNPAVILWSLGNENWSFWPTSGEFVAAQVDVARRWDPTRPTTNALLAGACFLPDFVGAVVDVISINEYFGWYVGLPEHAGDCFAFLKRQAPDKPIVVSEFGAGALPGRHVDPAGVGLEPLDDHSYSEEFQAWLLGIHLTAAHEHGLDGTMPWILADFHMEWNPTTGKPHPADNTNLKGLCSHDRVPKLSYEVVRSYYTDPAFLSGP